MARDVKMKKPKVGKHMEAYKMSGGVHSRRGLKRHSRKKPHRKIGVRQ